MQIHGRGAGLQETPVRTPSGSPCEFAEDLPVSKKGRQSSRSRPNGFMGLTGLCARQCQKTMARQRTGIMGNYGELWGIMGNYGVLWGCVCNT